MPFSPVLPIVSAVLCLWLMLNLTTLTWVRFGVWLVLGVLVYFAYGRRHARVGLAQGRAGQGGQVQHHAGTALHQVQRLGHVVMLHRGFPGTQLSD